MTLGLIILTVFLVVLNVAYWVASVWLMFKGENNDHQAISNRGAVRRDIARSNGRSVVTGHDARQYGDQMHCHICGKQWDVNDSHPPRCTEQPVVKIKSHSGRRSANGEKWIKKIRIMLENAK